MGNGGYSKYCTETSFGDYLGTAKWGISDKY